MSTEYKVLDWLPPRPYGRGAVWKTIHSKRSKIARSTIQFQCGKKIKSGSNCSKHGIVRPSLSWIIKMWCFKDRSSLKLNQFCELQIAIFIIPAFLSFQKLQQTYSQLGCLSILQGWLHPQLT